MSSSPVRPRLTVARRRLVDRILDQLLDLEPEARSRQLAKLGVRAPRVTVWLRELVAADSDTQPFFETLFERLGQAAQAANQAGGVELAPGTRLGPWRIIEMAGSGGMGAVYRAERADAAFSMVVAIKLIRLQRESFEEHLRLERELLARLDCHNIARLIDGGTTPDDQSYLVMEWIEGRDLDVFVTEECPDLDGRLDLFDQIAEGVVHAHQQRVIHGDLKPSNIRVADDGRVCLVDFGVARLIAEGEEPDSQSFKALTPAFSAPEQLAGKAATTQSDVWAMGVVLEWLVTGVVPDHRDSGRSLELPGSTPRKADLRAIIEQACHPEPGTRYAGIARLLDDLRRYRNRFPVRARERTRLLVARRFMQRHRLAVSTSAVAVMALCMALAGAVWQAHQATVERDRASAEAERALHAEAEASRLAEELQAVVEFQEARLSGIDPAAMGLQFREALVDQRRRAMAREVMDPDAIEHGVDMLTAQLVGINLTDLAREALDENILIQALEAIDTQFGDQPLVRARLLQAIAITARDLGLLDRALPPQLETLAIRRAWLGDRHPDTIDSIGRLASLYGSLGDHEQALAHRREALQTSREVHGDDHPNTLTQLNNLAVLFEAGGDYERAEGYFRAALHGRQDRLGDDHPDTISAAGNLGAALSSQDRYEEAQPFYQDVLDRRARSLGDEHPDTVRAVANMGMLLVRLDRLEEALPYYQSALDSRRRILGNDHPQTLHSLNNMGFLLSRLDRMEEAAVFYREVIDRSRALLGDRHPNTLIYINNIGTLYRNMGELDVAEALAAEAVASGRAVLAPGHWHLGVFLAGYGLVLADQSRFDEAEAALLEAYDLYAKALGHEHSRPVSLVPELVDLYERWHAQVPGNGHEASAAAWRQRMVVETP